VVVVGFSMRFRNGAKTRGRIRTVQPVGDQPSGRFFSWRGSGSVRDQQEYRRLRALRVVQYGLIHSTRRKLDCGSLARTRILVATPKTCRTCCPSRSWAWHSPPPSCSHSWPSSSWKKSLHSTASTFPSRDGVLNAVIRLANQTGSIALE